MKSAQATTPDMPLPPASALAATRFTIGDFDVSFLDYSLILEYPELLIRDIG